MLLHWYKSLFADELSILICPHEILVKRTVRNLKSRLKPEVVGTKKIAVSRTADENGDSNYHEIIIENLKQLLNEPISREAKLHVVLSNHFVKYVVIPWNADISSTDERLAYMKHCFVQAFGEGIKNWDCRMSLPAYGKSAIASAVDMNLITKIYDLFESLNKPLQGISPYLGLIINHAIEEIEDKNLTAKSEEFWIAVVQNQRVCIVLHDDSGWRLVKNLMADDDVLSQISAMIQREKINISLNENLPILVYWPESKTHLADMHAQFIFISPCYLDAAKHLNNNFNRDWTLA